MPKITCMMKSIFECSTESLIKKELGPFYLESFQIRVRQNFSENMKREKNFMRHLSFSNILKVYWV